MFQSAPETNSERNKRLVRTYAELYSRGEMGSIAELCAPTVVMQGVLGKGDIQFAVGLWTELHRAFAPQLLIEDIVAEDETVAVRYTERGTFRAPFRGSSPTGKSYMIVAMEWFKFRDGKIIERWGTRDSAAIMRQVALA